MFSVIEIRSKLIFAVGRYARFLCTSLANDRQENVVMPKFFCCCERILISKFNPLPLQLCTLRKFSVLKPNVCQIHLHKNPRIENIKETLIHEFECSEEEARDVVRDLSNNTFEVNEIIKSVDVLKRNGFGRECVPFLAKIPNCNSSYILSAINYLKQLHDNLRDVSPLLCVPCMKLKKIVKNQQKCEYYPEGGKIRWLSELFQCDVYFLCGKLVRYPEVLMLSPDHILNMIEFFKDGGIPQHYIVNDMKFLFLRKEYLQSRIDVLKKNGITDIRPWVLGCIEKNFERAIRRRVAERNVMGNYKSNLAYLAARLNCEEDRIPIIFQKIPQVKHMSVIKLKSILDFLYEEGYTAENVCKMPRVLTRSVNTLKSRLIELRELNCNPIYLSILCKTKKEYAAHIKLLKM